MSGSSSSVRDGVTPLKTDSPLDFTVHSLHAPAVDDAQIRRTKNGRMKMLLVLAVCAAPVLASYFAYFVVRPQGRTNYSELIQPQRPLPAGLPLANLQGEPVSAESLKGQWLLLVVSTADCGSACERRLWIQRQLRETLGRDADRVDKVWLISDDGMPSESVLQGVTKNTETTVLRSSVAALSEWLPAAPGHAVQDHIYIVDPLGNLMMRAPAEADPAQLKSDLVKLLRASAGWDQPGR